MHRQPRIDARTALRMVVGLILIGGAIYNALWTLRHPELFGLDGLARDASLDVYRWFFGDVVAATPAFDSFVVPGLLLGIVVVGSMLGAAWATWRRSRWADGATLFAGGIMLGWIIIEMAMIHDDRPLQAAIALLALLTLALGGLRMRFWPARA